MAKTITVAIDGPAGAGKSTIARQLARELGVEDCREVVEARVRAYEQRLELWMDREKTDQQDWAVFLQK